MRPRPPAVVSAYTHLNGIDVDRQLFRLDKIRLVLGGLTRIIEFVDELPKTISGKIRRVEIREKDKR